MTENPEIKPLLSAEDDWTPNPVEIASILEQFFPEEGLRRSTINLLADAVELSHSESSSCWSITVYKAKNLIRLNVGKFAFVSLRQSQIRITLEAAPEGKTLPSAIQVIEEFKALPGLMFVEIPADRFEETMTLEVRRLFRSALHRAALQSPMTPYSRHHTPTVIQYLNSTTGRSLPQPQHVRPSKEPMMDSTPLFSQETFSLLSEVSQAPVKATYLDKKEDFVTYVEKPVRALMAEVATQLPKEMTDLLETSSRIFSRILKNDYGRGGAWGHYWGAFYPKGGKRIEDAQLYVSASPNQISLGFAIGSYGSETSNRFYRNVELYKDSLAKILQEDLNAVSYSFGDFSLPPDSETSPLRWLQNIEELKIGAHLYVNASEIIHWSRERTITYVVSAFTNLFPLVLAATLDQPMEAIARYRGELDEDSEETQPERPLEDIAADFGFDLSELHGWARAIQRKNQAILYGPPGTGKTFVAQELAKHLIGGGTGFSDLVQFHPAYAYEDFMQGIRPEVEGGQVTYRLTSGRFLEFCQKARRTQDPCVLIIDEINRANLARVFGELMYLLENREEMIPLSGGGKLAIPSNVFIIGTMNTADRSIALVDHALRRRFAFLRLAPDFEILRHFHQQHTDFDPSGLIAQLKRINEQINDPHYEVGISFFLRKSLKRDLEDIWVMEITPYLEEYFFDQTEKAESFRWNEVKQRVLGD